VNRENFVYYLKELEVRYNYRDNVEDNLYICLDGIKWEITLYKILPYVKYSFTEIENLIVSCRQKLPYQLLQVLAISLLFQVFDILS
jgi:hypothetical protein